MAMDTPARIAVLGAGPIGLEAALYARYLGYDVDIYERSRVVAHLRQWGHVKLFSPWRMNRSPLGMAALKAQDPAWRPPDDGALLTGRELAEAYYLPLAASDLLVDGLHEHTTVVGVTREGLLKGDLVGDESRMDYPFRILLRDRSGQESAATADAIIDATGTYTTHNWLGSGGLPALGEQSLENRIEYGLPDILGADRERYAGRRTLLVGSGYSAASSAVALADLAATAPGTQVTWITRRGPTAGAGPIPVIDADRLPQRDALARRASAVAAMGNPVFWIPGRQVAALKSSGETEPITVRLSGEPPVTFDVDQILAQVGYRPDGRLYSELQIHECYASGGPMKLAAALRKNVSPDCLDQAASGPESLINPEPDFYILGAKSYGRNSQFLLALGLEQVRELFTVIGDRADLNLYATVGNLC